MVLRKHAVKPNFLRIRWQRDRVENLFARVWHSLWGGDALPPDLLPNGKV